MWKTVRLGDVVSFEKVNGKDSGLPYLGMENISSETMQLVGDVEIPESTSATFIFDDSQVLYGRLRPYLKKVLLPDFKGQCSTEIFCLKPNEALLRGYLAYWLLNPIVASAIEKTSTGARMPRANMNAILNFEIQLPPLAEQQRIVAKLDAAFAEIDRALGIIFRQESEVKKLFAAALSYQISAQDFSKANIQTLCEIGDGNHSSNYPKKAEMVASGVPFIRAGNIQNGTVIDDDLRFISEEKHAQLKKGHLREGDVLITNRGEIGKTAIVPKQFNGANLNSQIAWLRPHDNLLSEFLFFALNTTNAKNTFVLQQSGAALQQLTIKQLKAFEIPLPSLEQQQRIVECLRDVSTHTNKLSGNLFEKQKQLQTTKSALLVQELQPQQSEAA